MDGFSAELEIIWRQKIMAEATGKMISENKG